MRVTTNLQHQPLPQTPNTNAATTQKLLPVPRHSDDDCSTCKRKIASNFETPTSDSLSSRVSESHHHRHHPRETPIPPLPLPPPPDGRQLETMDMKSTGVEIMKKDDKFPGRPPPPPPAPAATDADGECLLLYIVKHACVYYVFPPGLLPVLTVCESSSASAEPSFNDWLRTKRFPRTWVGCLHLVVVPSNFKCFFYVSLTQLVLTSLW